MIEWLWIPRLIDCIFLGMAFEALLLLKRHRSMGLKGLPTIFLTIASGVCLILAMKLSIAGYSEISVAAALGLAGLAHIADVRSALKREAGSASSA